jgi:hypothetical protein
MEILLERNFYRHTRGEDTALKAEIDLLRACENDVPEHRRHNSNIINQSLFSMAISIIWSTKQVRDLQNLCRQFEPVTIHVNNIFPLISPHLYWFSSVRQISIIQTLVSDGVNDASFTPGNANGLAQKIV